MRIEFSIDLISYLFFYEVDREPSPLQFIGVLFSFLFVKHVNHIQLTPKRESAKHTINLHALIGVVFAECRDCKNYDDRQNGLKRLILHCLLFCT